MYLLYYEGPLKFLAETLNSQPSWHIVYLIWFNFLFDCLFNPLTAGVAYIRVFIFYYKYHFLNMLTIKYDINQQYLKTVDLHFVQSE